MGYGRGVKMGLAEPVNFLSEEELAERGTKAGLATPVHVINVGDFNNGGGNGNDLTYTHIQGVPASVWLVEHNLNKYPSVSVVDSADSLVAGDVQYINSNQLTVTFSGAFSGKAYIN